MRLVDADKLIKDIVNLLQPARPDETEMYKADDIFWSLEKLIKEQPTAFDVDKVVGEIDLLREKAQKRREEFIELNSHNNVIIKNIEYERGRVYAFDDAIEVVKAGGIDE